MSNNYSKIAVMLAMACVEMLVVLIFMLVFSLLGGLILGFVLAMFDVALIYKWYFDAEEEKREKEELRKWQEEHRED